MKIPNDVIPIAYSVSKKVYNKELSFIEGKTILSVSASMNASSAADYINNFKYLIEGKRFTRTLNVFSMEYFLENILKDFGIAALEKALYALKEHIEYYEGIQKTNVTLHKMRYIHARFSAKIENKDLDEQEQVEIIHAIKKQKISKQELLAELKSIKENDPEEVLIMGKAYKRDNKTVAQIKILRDFKCQFCGITIKKKDGSFYIEAAHIKPKHLKGCETLYNIILLCPNHHKEFDLGDRNILYQDKSSVIINLNEKEYKVLFE